MSGVLVNKFGVFLLLLIFVFLTAGGDDQLFDERYKLGRGNGSLSLFCLLYQVFNFLNR